MQQLLLLQLLLPTSAMTTNGITKARTNTNANTQTKANTNTDTDADTSTHTNTSTDAIICVKVGIR